jgi:2-C-methyl-D-erythritol 4-phosphate cytidylyltransferase/2-C-methyl-D-erythritol 2,4-cyclodiphosphate synthase
MKKPPLPPMHLIILAGGQSSRARRSDSAAPKQFRQVGGTMLLMWSVHELLSVEDEDSTATGSPAVATLTLAVPEAWHAVVHRELERSEPACPWSLAGAGRTRSDSTWQAITTLAKVQPPMEDDLVAVHDAARPFATHHLLLRLAEAAAHHGAAVPGIPVTDTIVQIEEGKRHHVEARYLDRDGLRALQTPQVFRWGPFFEAHAWCQEQKLAFTDDGGLLAARGLSPLVVMGEVENWKITTESDLERVDAIFKAGRALRHP